jgi:hypothetical protein
MVKCTKKQIRQLKTALRRRIPAAQREVHPDGLFVAAPRERDMALQLILVGRSSSSASLFRAQLPMREGGAAGAPRSL